MARHYYIHQKIQHLQGIKKYIDPGCSGELGVTHLLCKVKASKASSDLVQNYSNDLEDPTEHFTDILTNIANSTIPKSKPRSKNVILFG